jgi:hypothetical protein
MKDFFLNRQINKLEQEANDDFLQILSFGARCYPTKELHALLRRLDKEAQRIAYYRRLVLLVGGSATLWIAFCFLFQSLDFTFGIYFTLTLVPITLVAFTVGNIYINRKFRAIRSAHLIEKIIVEELDRRRKDASIF